MFIFRLWTNCSSLNDQIYIYDLQLHQSLSLTLTLRVTKYNNLTIRVTKPCNQLNNSQCFRIFGNDQVY